MNELIYKHRIIMALEGRGVRCQPHEDRIDKYIPDVSFSGNGTDGWIEVKYCETAPKQLASIDHWTKGQEQWLYDFGRVGSGHCYLLIGVGADSHYLWGYNKLAMVRNILFKDAKLLCAAKADGIVPFIQAFLSLTITKRRLL